MARFRNVAGERIPFTAEQEAARDAEEAQDVLDKEAQALVQYQTDRQNNYPSIGDQLDALWKGGQAQADLKILIDGVKAAHPKPGA